jgi:hypothetical protein
MAASITLLSRTLRLFYRKKFLTPGPLKNMWSACTLFSAPIDLSFTFFDPFHYIIESGIF